HWDGSQWSVVEGANVNWSALKGIAAVSTNDIWAVGIFSNIQYGFHGTLVEHWNGNQWSAVSSPNGGLYNNDLVSVSTVSANDVWAVGFYDVLGGMKLTLTEHWDGSQWSVVASPNVGPNGSLLEGVAARATNDVWSAGY